MAAGAATQCNLQQGGGREDTQRGSGQAIVAYFLYVFLTDWNGSCNLFW